MHTHTHTHTHTQARTHTHTHTQARTHTHVRTHTQAQTHTHTQTYTHSYTHTLHSVCCVCVSTHVLHTCAHTYIPYIGTHRPTHSMHTYRINDKLLLIMWSCYGRVIGLTWALGCRWAVKMHWPTTPRLLRKVCWIRSVITELQIVYIDKYDIIIHGCVMG